MPVNALSLAPVEETIHGVVVRDPYRWLEDRNLPETIAWMKEQQRCYDDYFAACENFDWIQSRVHEYLDIEVVDQPSRVAGRCFYRRRDPGQEQGCIYVRDAEGERLLVDPAQDGHFASVKIHRISRYGSLLAYEVKSGGEDTKSIHIVHVATGSVLPDKLDSGYARGFAFTASRNGFYYCHETSQDIYEHTIRLYLFDKPAADQVVFRATRSRGSRLLLTADATHLGAIWIHGVDDNLVADCWIARQEDTDHWRLVFANRKLPYNPVIYDGRIFVLSSADAPNGKIIEVSPDGQELRTIVPEQQAMIRQYTIAGDRIFVSYLEDMTPAIRCWDLAGQEQPGIGIPVDGAIQLLPNLGDGDTVFYRYESLTQPPMIFEYDPDRGCSEVWHQQAKLFYPHSVTVWHDTYASKDGTEVPITLACSHHTQQISPGPVMMTSYGGFGAPTTPQFSVLIAILIELGASFALPHIRGGGEFGKAWHDAGRRRNRQTSIDDFLAAAEWLCKRGITTPEQFAILGGSNSGLLAGAAMTQRPDLFSAVLSVAPLLDMVRYEQLNDAARWRQEYGTVEDEEDFHALLAYSPYHRIRDDANYPAVLFVSGEQDQRCHPAHVRKMAARLIERPAQRNAVLVDFSEHRGHSPNLPVTVRVEALTRRIAFLCRELHILIAPGGFDEATDH